MSERRHNLVAIDLGASSGRVVLGRLVESSLQLEVIHRFQHGTRQTGGKTCWDWALIDRQICDGLVKAADASGAEGIRAVSCSSWAQDFGLLDAAGDLFYPPVSYRDPRTSGMPANFSDVIVPNDLVGRVGSGATPVTTLCQLRAMSRTEPDVLSRAERLLFIADLVHYRLCGVPGTDWTMATASQLRNLQSGTWDADLLGRLGIPHHFLPSIADDAVVLGPIARDNGIDPRLAGVPVVSAAGHDTAAAAACAAPLTKEVFFLSLGTWGMLGCCTGELAVPDAPADNGCAILGLPERKWAVFRSEVGLWLLEECRRHWDNRGVRLGHDPLVEAAAGISIASRIDPSHPRFHAPADMLAEIENACREARLPSPSTPGEFARVVFESLASHYGAAVRKLGQAVGTEARCLHIVGGGSRNEYLCRRIADACGIPVIAGPAEATAIGNIVRQAKALGIVKGEAEAADLIRASFPTRRCDPSA